MIRYKDENGEIQDIAGNLMPPINLDVFLPVGVVLAFIRSDIPDNLLLCDGSEFDTDTYPELYELLGTNKVPDLREVALVGAGQNSTDSIATHDVFTVGQFKDDQMQSHTHVYPTRDTVNKNGANSGSGVVGKSSTKSGNNNGRTTTVTRGKRKGVNYVIVAR